MFALMNPPLKRKKAKNTWFGEPQRHSLAAKKGWLSRKKRSPKKRSLKARKLFGSSIFTPGGGRIIRTAGRPQAYNSFMGINPLNSKGAVHMAKRKRGGRRSRFNFGFSTPKKSGFLAALKPSNMVGVLPILGGVIADGIFTKFLGEKIPYTRRGIGSIALGIAGAGLIGMVGRYGSKALGDGLFVGGMVGTLGCAFQGLMTQGVRSLSLGDDLDGFGDINPNPWTQYSFQGMGNFTTPGAIAHAMPSESTMSQYSLPNTNAQFMPQAQLQMPQTPAQGYQARHMADYESGAVGAMMSGSDDVSGMV